MNILLVTLEYPPFKGGVGVMYENIVKNWPKNDRIFVLDNGRGQLLKWWMRPRWLAGLVASWRAIGKNKIDHVIVGHILPLGWIIFLIAKLKKVEYSVFLHGMDFEFAHKKTRKANQCAKILGRARHIIGSNSFLISRVISKYPELASKCHIVNPGVETDFEISDEKAKQVRESYHLNDKIVFFSVSRLVKRKGIDTTIMAMKDLTRYSTRAYYVIAGDGPDKEYLKRLAKGVPNIIFLGLIDDSEKWAWLKSCDVFIMPSRNIDGDYEGFGIVYLEAALQSKPVIAGDCGGVKDAVQGAVTGILIDGENIDRVAGAMLALLQDKDLRNKMGQAGRERVLRDFTWARQTQRVYEIINPAKAILK